MNYFKNSLGLFDRIFVRKKHSSNTFSNKVLEESIRKIGRFFEIFSKKKREALIHKASQWSEWRDLPA